MPPPVVGKTDDGQQRSQGETRRESSTITSSSSSSVSLSRSLTPGGTSDGVSEQTTLASMNLPIPALRFSRCVTKSEASAAIR